MTQKRHVERKSEVLIVAMLRLQIIYNIPVKILSQYLVNKEYNSEQSQTKVFFLLVLVLKVLFHKIKYKLLNINTLHTCTRTHTHTYLLTSRKAILLWKFFALKAPLSLVLRQGVLADAYRAKTRRQQVWGQPRL